MKGIVKALVIGFLITIFGFIMWLVLTSFYLLIAPFQAGIKLSSIYNEVFDEVEKEL